jgi:hypothetical protein
VTQDKSYRWWPKGTPVEKREPEQQAKLDTPLARLCRYYFDCLNHDDQGGLSVFASSQYGDLDYVELGVLPLLSDQPDAIFQDEGARKLLNKTRQDRSRLALVLGYPVRLTKARSRKGWEGFFVEPMLLSGF